MTGIKWIDKLPYLLLAGLMVLFLSTHTPYVEYDIDPSYILLGPSRPPLYPLFIQLFHWAGDYQFVFIMWLQGIFLFTALLYARQWLLQKMQLPDLVIILISMLVLVTISFHFQIWYIQSEGLAFPLFILAFFLLIDCFYKFQFKNIFYLSFVVSLLVLTRLQFYYFYILFALLCIWYLWQRISLEKVIAAFIILFCSMLLTILINHTYHYVKHGNFASGSYSQLMILVQTLYLADNDAAKYFSDPEEKNYIQTMINQRNAQKLNQDVMLAIAITPTNLRYAYQSYSRNYLTLQNIIDSTLQTSVENTVETHSIYQANSIAGKINKILILHDWKKNIMFFIWKFIECMGGLTLLLFFSIILLSSLFTIISNKIRQPDLSFLFVTIVTIMTFANALIIAICNPDLPVYFCYSQFIFYCLAGLLIKKTFINYHANDEKKVCQKYC